MIFWTKDKFSMNLGKVQTAFKIFLVLENKLKFDLMPRAESNSVA
jgi:hypothetical protein